MDEKMSSEAPRKRLQMSGIRYLFTLLSFLGFAILYIIRVNLNVAIVAMVNRTAVYKDHNDSKSEECPEDLPPILQNQTSSGIQKDGEFIWFVEMQSVVIGAFYYGYAVSQIPGGRLAELYSAKWVFGLGTFIPCLLTVLTPLAARANIGVLIAVRALEGLAQGVTLPAMYSLMGRWFPDSEKAFLSALVRIGFGMGTVAGMNLSAYLCENGPFGGWPSAFYIVGILGCIWFALWTFLVSESPANHPFITTKEIKLIISDQKTRQDTKLPPIPWKKMLTSVPFIALLITQIGDDWCFFTILNDLPTFFDTILHFNIEKNGFLSSFPRLLQIAVTIIVGFTSDLFVRRKYASVGFMRKFCQMTTTLGAVLGLLGVCLSGCNANLHIAFFTIAMTFSSFSAGGYILTPLDLSPEYSGTVAGIASTLSNATGFLAPLVVGVLTDESQTLHQWHIVFYITMGIFLSTGLVFLFFSSAEKQPWSFPETSYYGDLQTMPGDETLSSRILEKPHS
ncbi:sialin-like [Uloborus diversus]|uniref:sialin-like n=1 Tax=Uloborus diversus TaxID=327109 RepID=UPI00240914C3|nr:sialin-like [Uloborus diversus]XP_054716200.1 sialin-like [Uloborus diversus]